MTHSVPTAINRLQIAINEIVPYYRRFNNSNVSIGNSKKQSPHIQVSAYSQRYAYKQTFMGKVTTLD